MQTDSFGSFSPTLAVEFVASFEGLRLRAYQCSAGVWTVGYGHTGKDVFQNLVIDEDRARELLIDDLNRHAQSLARYINKPVNSNQYVALLSLTFNVGVHAVASSTLLRLINAGNFSAAADQFLRWNKANGKVLNGLTRRRLAEKELFLKNE